MRTEEFTVVADDGERIVGTFTAPADRTTPAAGVIMINGSGPLDRDSNVPGQHLGVLPAFAEAFANRGVASARFDKRGTGASSGSYLECGFDQETADAGLVLRAARRWSGIDPSRLFVLGHSVGATIAASLAAVEPLAGTILLGCAASPGEEVMRWQAERIAAAFRGPRRLTAGWFVRRQARLRHQILASADAVARIGGQIVPARWLREYMTHDPRPDLRRIRTPVLAITGQKDVQVPAGDVARIGELVAGPFTGNTPAALTHLLRADSGPAGLDSYPEQLTRPPDPELITTVVGWVTAPPVEQVPQLGRSVTPRELL